MGDKLVAERDIVLTYALEALAKEGLMEHLAFKGGTCLRKMMFGSDGRFSEDLDFTLDTDRDDDDVLCEIVEIFNRTHHGITFRFEEYYKSDGDRSFGGDVTYQHDWNQAGRFRLQVSLRERPTLPAVLTPMKPQSYFKNLEFAPSEIRSLEGIEMMAEKIRAAFQRAKVRDIYDLHRFSSLPFSVELLRHFAVLKLWQSRDPFDPERLFEKIRGGSYDWNDLRRLLRSSHLLEPDRMLKTIETRFALLRALTEVEQAVIADAKSGRNEELAGRLRTKIRELSKSG